MASRSPNNALFLLYYFVTGRLEAQRLGVRACWALCYFLLKWLLRVRHAISPKQQWQLVDHSSLANARAESWSGTHSRATLLTEATADLVPEASGHDVDQPNVLDRLCRQIVAG